MSAKRSAKRPPPSPIRQGGAVRPPPPMKAAPVGAGIAGGGLGLKIGMGVGIGLVVVVVVAAGGLFGIVKILGRGGGEAVASVENMPASPTPPATDVNQENPPWPAQEESPKAVPAEPPKKNGPPTGSEKTNPASTKPEPPAPTPPASLPEANPPSPAVTPPESTPSATTPTPPSTTPSAASPLDDVRQRGNFLLIPEQKIAESIELAKIDVAKPADCDLAVMGTEDLLPMGQAVKLDRADSADKRIWTLSLQGTGALNKGRALADFTLSGKILAFQWRPGAAAGSFPLHYCLLRIDAGGEKELCRMAKPVPLPPLKITPGETASIELTLPLGIAQKSQLLRLEIIPIDFPSVNFPANQALKAGDGTTMTVTGSASGTVAPDLEIDVKFECAGAKAILKLSSAASWPPDAKGKSTKGKISAAMLETKKKEAGKKLTVLQKKKTLLEANKAALEKEETLLGNYMPRTFDERNQLAQKQALLTQELVNAQTQLDNCIALHDAATATENWCGDMLALCKDLESRSRLGIRIYREVGQEVIEIVAADPNATP